MEIPSLLKCGNTPFISFQNIPTMKSVLLFLVMSCMTTSLCAQWKFVNPEEGRLLRDERQKPFSMNSTLGFNSRRNLDPIQDEMYSNAVRQNAITHQLDSAIYMGISENTSQWVGFWRSGYQYTAEEKLEVETVESFNEFLHIWENSEKAFYGYNENQQVVLDSILTWDTNIGTWINSYKESMNMIHRCV